MVPVIYQTSIEKKEFNDMRIHLYIDLSDSTKTYHKIFYELIFAIVDIIGLPVYGFSNKVVELKLDDLKNGKIYTTNGTDIDCVIKHATSKNFQRIMIITDGYVNVKNSSVSLDKTRALQIYVIFTEENGSSKLFKENLVNIKDKGYRWWCMKEFF